jgi:hypothetical protein
VDWAPVFDRIAAELRRKVADTVPKPSVVIETAGELIDATAETRLHPKILDEFGWDCDNPTVDDPHLRIAGRADCRYVFSHAYFGGTIGPVPAF